jgi:hypothetical protein
LRQLPVVNNAVAFTAIPCAIPYSFANSTFANSFAYSDAKAGNHDDDADIGSRDIDLGLAQGFGSRRRHHIRFVR